MQINNLICVTDTITLTVIDTVIDTNGMKYKLRHLINAIDDQECELAKIILSSSKGKLINNGHSDDNTLIRSIKSVFSINNSNRNRFDPRIIELLFEHGVRCIVLPVDYNTLNTAIIWAGLYIESFRDEKKPIAEQNAIKILDLVIKHGARGINDRKEANTLSIAMRATNINILKFLINANLNLEPCNHDGSCCEWMYQSYYLTFDCALSASHKTYNPEFFRIALSNGAVPYNTSIMIRKIFESHVVSIVDWIVFGGDDSMRCISKRCFDIEKMCLYETITEEKKIKIMEIIACTSGCMISDEYNSIPGRLGVFVRRCCKMFDGKYSTCDKNSDKYKKIIDIKNRLASRIQWLIGVAKVCEKHNERKPIIENEMIQLPIALIDIIVGYDEYTPRFKTIDLSKY